jgi:3-phenylpropionate/cinnamic acid dioxygenase small subunit
MTAAVSIDPALEHELADFIAAEAALLDAARYDEWLALYTDDGRYWVPLQGARQADPVSHNSLAYEDRMLLALRIERLKNPRAHSQHPPSRCQHVLQRSAVDSASSADRAETRTPFLYVESRGDETLMLAGSVQHSLVRVGSAWKIRVKRVDLLDAERPLPAIQLFI